MSSLAIQPNLEYNYVLILTPGSLPARGFFFSCLVHPFNNICNKVGSDSFLRVPSHMRIV